MHAITRSTLPLALLATVALAPACGDDGGQTQNDAAVQDAAPDAATYPFTCPVRVLRVHDGDTIIVDMPGQDQEITIRFEGINCMEISPTVEPWAQEAKDYTTQHALPQTTIGLEFDDDSCCANPGKASCLDYYDRTLAYIRTAQGEDLAALLLGLGLAEIYQSSDCNRKAYYQTVENQAKAQNVGIWSD
jgi:endonuclease YncB( thermonuclease family)